MNKSNLSIIIGKDTNGNDVDLNLILNQHILITGTTGSGKDTFLCSFIYLLMKNNTPSKVKFILVDPTRVVLTPFQESSSLLAPVITELDSVPGMFKWLIEETEHRFNELLKEKVRNIDEYNIKMSEDIFPRIFVVIRELAEIMLGDPDKTEKNIVRITQLTKATGIHLIIASQLASTNVFTGLIKANIPARIAFNTSTSEKSMVILDQPGAEKLQGKGDMFLLTFDSTVPIRLTSTYIKEDELFRFVSENKAPEYDKGLLTFLKYNVIVDEKYKDELYDKAVEIVHDKKKASASILQTELQIGYSRAARMLEEMENNGIIGKLTEVNGVKTREILK